MISNALLLSLVVDDRKSRSLRTCSGCGGNCEENDIVRYDLLLKIVLRRIHVAVELDALGNVHCRTAACRNDDLSAGLLEEPYAFDYGLIERVRLEIGELSYLNACILEPVKIVLDLKEAECAVADQEYIADIVIRKISVQLGVFVFTA